MTDGKDLPVFLTTEELAAMLKKKPRTIEDWRLDGKGPEYIKLGVGTTARVLYPLSEVNKWLTSLLKKPT
ncbi:MAG: helix-turn-helix domain-containing protein [Proteobacteria bacterium]|nr:helix-turn-helix domain-containing protein [Pseudomonadota bacterium]